MLLKINFIICVIIGIFCYYVIPKNRVMQDRLFLSTTFLILLFIHTFVDVNSLPDLANYENAFNILSHTAWNRIFVDQIEAKMEDGFILMMKLTSFIGGNFRLFLFFTSLLILVPYYYLINKLPAHKFIAVMFLLLSTYNQSLFVLRQHIAVAMTLCTYSFIIDRRLWHFLLVICIAFFIHQSVIIFIPVYFLYGIKNNRMLILLLVIVTFVLYSSFGLILEYFAYNILEGYTSYVESDLGTNFTGFIISLYKLLFFIIAVRKRAFTEPILKLLFIIVLLSAVIQFVGVGFNPVGRMVIYFNAFTCLLVPFTMMHLKPLYRFLYLAVLLFIGYYASFYGSSYQYIENAEIVF